MHGFEASVPTGDDVLERSIVLSHWLVRACPSANFHRAGNLKAASKPIRSGLE